MTTLTKEAVAPLGVKPRDAERSKNFFALGLVVVDVHPARPSRPSSGSTAKFGSKPLVARRQPWPRSTPGTPSARPPSSSTTPTRSSPATLEPGTYTNITGNTALAWGLIAAGQLSQLPFFLGSYPITPASDILHELSKHKDFGVRTLQAEDEIAGIGAALGAAFGGHLAVTTTSGPGIALKSETMGLAVSLELPLLVIDIQRGGPSTGLPTKTEAADLLQAMYGRHGESPVPIVAAYSPSHCFDAAIEAARLALKYRTPVMLLSDGYLANGSEPWLLPDIGVAARHLGRRSPPRPTTSTTTAPSSSGPTSRDPRHLGPAVGHPRHAWAGAPHRRHREGGRLRKHLLRPRQPRAHGPRSGPPRSPASPGTSRRLEVRGDVDDAEILVLGWGSTWGAIDGAMDRCQRRGRKVAHAHLVHLNPFPADLGEVLARYPKVLVPEMNLGQLVKMVRAEFLVDARSVTKVQGVPFTASELETAVLAELDR